MSAYSLLEQALRIVQDSDLFAPDELAEFGEAVQSAMALLADLGTGGEWVRETDPAWAGGKHGLPLRKREQQSWVRVWRDGAWDVRGAYHNASTVPQELEAAKVQALRVARGEAR